MSDDTNTNSDMPDAGLSDPVSDEPEVEVEVEVISVDDPKAHKWFRGFDKRINDKPRPKPKKPKRISVGPDLGGYFKDNS